MTHSVLELASITLAEGSTEADLLAASTHFQTAFLDHQPGFLRRDLVRKGDGSFLDVVLWESRADADAVMEQAQGSEAVGQYFSHMVFDPEAMEEGVEHCTLLGSYAAKTA